MAETDTTADRMQIPEYVRRELSEVYLLMDHIAGRKDKTLDDALAAKVTGAEHITLEQLCGVAWPPPPDGNRAKALALVLTAKDRLSRAAYPATGYSVAFTHLTFAKYIRRGSPTRRLFASSHRNGAPQSKGCRDGAAPAPVAISSTMVQFAKDAFPGLEAARESPFEKMIALFCLLLILLTVTCAVSWDLAIGQRLLADFRWLSSHPEVLIINPSEPSCQSVVNPKQIVARDQCARSLARDRVVPLASSWIGWQYILKTVTCDLDGCAPGDKQADPSVALEQTRLIVTTLNFNVLPLLLGSLAATAAALRNIAAKIARQELEPRDLTQVWPRVLLGAFLGSMIGLFIAPGPSNGFFNLAGDGDSTSTVALSPAAFAFLAGFATGRIFQWLDSLVERIFAVANPKP